MGAIIRVRVKGSPYAAVKEGAVGEIIERKFVNSPHEVLKVRLKGGAIWTFFPDEVTETGLERIDGRKMRA